MPVPGERGTVQSPILAYAQQIGWSFVSREEAERRRGFDPSAGNAAAARQASLHFDDLLHAKVLELNPRYKEAEGALAGELRRLRADIRGNRDFLGYLHNRGKYFCAEGNRELGRGKLWKSLMRAHLGDWESLAERLPRRDVSADVSSS